MKKGIYKITSPIGKIYIGQSTNLVKREYSYSLLHCKTQPKLYNSIKKYGWDNHIFEIIHEFDENTTVKILNEYELLYWKKYVDLGVDMMNITEPGNFKRHSEETKLKISQANKGKPTWSKGKKQTESSNLKRSISQKGKKLTEEHRNKLSEVRRKKVLQFDKLGNFLCEFNSYSEAKEKTGIDCQFALVYKNKTAGGFIWIYKSKWNGYPAIK
jgi:group I intron endonuclease